MASGVVAGWLRIVALLAPIHFGRYPQGFVTVRCGLPTCPSVRSTRGPSLLPSPGVRCLSVHPFVRPASLSRPETSSSSQGGLPPGYPPPPRRTRSSSSFVLSLRRIRPASSLTPSLLRPALAGPLPSYKTEHVSTTGHDDYRLWAKPWRQRRRSHCR